MPGEGEGAGGAEDCCGVTEGKDYMWIICCIFPATIHMSASKLRVFPCKKNKRRRFGMSITAVSSVKH